MGWMGSNLRVLCTLCALLLSILWVPAVALCSFFYAAVSVVATMLFFTMDCGPTNMADIFTAGFRFLRDEVERKLLQLAERSPGQVVYDIGILLLIPGAVWGVVVG